MGYNTTGSPIRYLGSNPSFLLISRLLKSLMDPMKMVLKNATLLSMAMFPEEVHFSIVITW